MSPIHRHNTSADILHIPGNDGTLIVGTDDSVFMFVNVCISR